MDSLPKIDDSLFSSDDFLAATGQDTIRELDNDKNKKENYGNIGLSTGVASSTLKPPEKPDVSKMKSKAKTAALEKYSREMKEYQKQKKAETDCMLKERRKEAGGRAIRWAAIQYSGDNTPTLRIPQQGVPLRWVH